MALATYGTFSPIATLCFRDITGCWCDLHRCTDNVPQAVATGCRQRNLLPATWLQGFSVQAQRSHRQQGYPLPPTAQAQDNITASLCDSDVTSLAALRASRCHGFAKRGNRMSGSSPPSIARKPRRRAQREALSHLVACATGERC